MYKFLDSIHYKLKNNYILYLINFLILASWLVFIYFNLITINRLIFFFEVLFFIFFYKLVIKFTKNIKIDDIKVLNFLINFNKYKNPLLLFLLKFEEFIFDFLCNYTNKLLIYLIFIIYIFIINPIKVLLYKYYKLFNLWITNKYYTIIINRMFGLILSILIFTNIIMYLKVFLGLNILVIVYLYLFIIALLSEYNNKYDCNNKLLRIFLEPQLSSYNIISYRLHTNIIGLILEYNNIEAKLYYINLKNLYNIEKFRIGYTWASLNSVKKYKDKPSYWLYLDILLELDQYLFHMQRYIYMEICNWNTKYMDKIKFNGKLNNFNQTDYEKSKFLYKFDYKIFNLLLFMIYDLESYLGRDIRVLINITDDDGIIFLSCFESMLSDEKFFEVIKSKSEFKLFNQDVFIKLKSFFFF